jgi:hypothetical protein
MVYGGPYSWRKPSIAIPPRTAEAWLMKARTRHRLHFAIGHRPAIMLPLLRRRSARQAIARSTEVLIEGSGGSGNSFACRAFLFAQGGNVRLAGHTHVPAQVIQAARWKIPALVLIRDPVDAAASMVTRFREGENPMERARIALERYVHFYSSIAGYRDRFLVCRFPDLITDFGAVVEALNARFGTRFLPFSHDEATMQACFKNRRPDRIKPNAAVKRLVGTMIRDAAELKPLVERANGLWMASAMRNDQNVLVTAVPAEGGVAQPSTVRPA